jgi:hypothetical protein
MFNRPEQEPQLSLESLAELLPEEPSESSLKRFARLALIIIYKTTGPRIDLDMFTAEQVSELGKLAYPILRQYLLDPGSTLSPFQRWAVIQAQNLSGTGKSDFTDEVLRERFNVSLEQANTRATDAIPHFRRASSLKDFRALIEKTVQEFRK